MKIKMLNSLSVRDKNGGELRDSERVSGEGDIKVEPVQRQIYTNISNRKQTEQNRT